MGSSFPTLDFVPVGFRFRPTDEELVNHYLKHKLLGHDSIVERVIPEIDVCKVEPWDLPAVISKSSVINSDDPEWFFFSPRDYKYAKSKRFNRTTKRGFWKATGTDRNIKIRGTNNVIGTKKTLVFHEGRVPGGVKRNWVIHEYHAVTFDESQRTFVLCRLMKKVEKKAEGETDALVYDEGEPSRHMGSDYENQATLEVQDISGILPEVNLESIFQADTHFPLSTQQSPTGFGFGFEQELSFPNSPIANAYFGNEIFSTQTPFETTEDEDDFVNSILISEDVVTNKRREHAFVNGPAQFETLRRVYYDSSDTDAEVASVMSGNILETPSSSEYRASKLFKSSHGVVHGSTHQLYPNNVVNRNKKESAFRDDFWRVETSSGGSTADKPQEINCTEITRSPSTLRRSKNQFHPRPANFIAQRSATKRSQTQRKVSGNVVSHAEAEKEMLIVRSAKIQSEAQNTSSSDNLQTRSRHSSDVNRKGSLIYMETISPSQRLFPRSVYLANVVIGIFLLIVISWDVFSC